jgi:tRNA-splicing ligase RtcB (3'-phosphate/5'-hydroxy nucleic acid ligase)
MSDLTNLEKISDVLWQLPSSYKSGMRVPARIYATESLIKEMDDAVFDQISNVAMLPGVIKYAFCMPDGHSGYGFPIGGVAAMDAKYGVISPGGIGFDINCGMRLLTTDLTLDDIGPRLKKLVDRLYQRVPAGVGAKGFLKLSRNEFRSVVEQGAKWCVHNGYGWAEDLELTELNGCIEDADAAAVSDRAVDRGIDQVGTLGSGNHYLEIQVLKPENVFDSGTAATFGLHGENQITVMFHCGSRGFGHQVASDYLQLFLNVMGSKYKISVPDRELACAPLNSPEGKAYFAAMKCAINMSFANRQVILHRIREVFSEIFSMSPERLKMHMVYDVSHNTAQIERHEVDGIEKELLVHRKGSTRAFGPGHRELPERFRKTGQPVIIGGSMETGSYLLAGVSTGAQSFYSTAHGSGRTMSRAKARKIWQGRSLQQDLEQHGIYVRTASWSGLSEEAGNAYKNIDEVVKASELAGLSRRIARFVPVGNVKG